MRRLPVLAFICMAAMATAAQPVSDAGALLRHMLEAAPKLRYSGTRTVTLRAGIDRRVHTELIEKDGARTRVEFPKDSPYRGQVIVESEKERRHFFPEHNEIHVQPARRERAFQRLLRLANGKGAGRRIQVADGGVVAGLHTSVLTLVEPRGNAMQRMWIEPRSGMLVKRELYDRSGAVQGGFEFTQVNLSPRIDGRDFRLDVRGAKIVAPRDDLHEFTKRLNLPEVSLPPDAPFQLDGVRIQKMGGMEVLVQQYTNDDRDFTFFQLRGAIDQGKLRKQARSFQSVTWQKDGVSSVLVGDLAATMLEDLARQLGK